MSTVQKRQDEAINQTIKCEMEAITQSLTKITKVISQSSKQRKSNVSDDVADKMQKTLSLWNTMMNGLGETTNLNIS